MEGAKKLEAVCDLVSLSAVNPVENLEAVLDILGAGQQQGLLPASQGQPGGLGVYSNVYSNEVYCVHTVM